MHPRGRRKGTWAHLSISLALSLRWSGQVNTAQSGHQTAQLPELSVKRHTHTFLKPLIIPALSVLAGADMVCYSQSPLWIASLPSSYCAIQIKSQNLMFFSTVDLELWIYCLLKHRTVLKMKVPRKCLWRLHRRTILGSLNNLSVNIS